jgi:hypothetical protein
VLLDAAGVILLRWQRAKPQNSLPLYTGVSVEASRWLSADVDVNDAARADDGTAGDDANSDSDADSCCVMADTIRLLLLPRSRLCRAASLAGDRDALLLMIQC